MKRTTSSVFTASFELLMPSHRVVRHVAEEPPSARTPVQKFLLPSLRVSLTDASESKLSDRLPQAYRCFEAPFGRPDAVVDSRSGRPV